MGNPVVWLVWKDDAPARRRILSLIPDAGEISKRDLAWKLKQKFSMEYVSRLLDEMQDEGLITLTTFQCPVGHRTRVIISRAGVVAGDGVQAVGKPPEWAERAWEAIGRVMGEGKREWAAEYDWEADRFGIGLVYGFIPAEGIELGRLGQKIRGRLTFRERDIALEILSADGRIGRRDKIIWRVVDNIGG